MTFYNKELVLKIRDEKGEQKFVSLNMPDGARFVTISFSTAKKNYFPVRLELPPEKTLLWEIYREEGK
jgi:hypothetical protein